MYVLSFRVPKEMERFSAPPDSVIYWENVHFGQDTSRLHPLDRFNTYQQVEYAT